MTRGDPGPLRPAGDPDTGTPAAAGAPGDQAPGDDGIPTAIALWGASIAHQVHNLDLVLSSALHVLDGAGGADATPAARTQALRVGQTALRRTAGIIAALAGLSEGDGGDERIDAGELLVWIDTLTGPRARQSDARLTIDRAAVAGIGIDRRRSARAALALVAGAVEGLGRGRHIHLVAEPESMGARLELRLEGFPAEELRRLVADLSARLRLLPPASGGITPAGGWVRLPGRGAAGGGATAGADAARRTERKGRS